MKSCNKNKLTLLLLLTLAACGQAKNEVEITLLPSIGFKPKNFASLSQHFFSKPTSVAENILSISGPSCKQIGLRAALKEGNATIEKLITFPVFFSTAPHAGTAPGDAAMDEYLNDGTKVQFDQPIKITAPKGTELEVGLMGAIFNPGASATVNDTNNDGICDDFDGTNAHTSTSVIGHKPIGIINQNVSIPLNVFIFNAAPNSTPTPPVRAGGTITTAGAYYCNLSQQNTFELCPVKDIVQIKNTASNASYCKVTAVEYLFSEKNTPPILHKVKDNTVFSVPSGYMFVPSLYPLKIFTTLGGTTTTFTAFGEGTFTPPGCPNNTIVVSKVE